MRKTALMLALILCFNGVIHAQDENQCEPGTRVFEHALGTTCVPDVVERVVALEWSYVEDLLALDVQPVGVADIEGYHAWVDVPVALDEAVPDVGTRQEPNLERIAELEPDLIIGPSFRMVENYDDLSVIAPTLAFNAYPEDVTHYEEMVSTFNTIAGAVNREAQADQVLADLEDYFEQANAALETAGRAGEGFILSQSFMSSEIPTFRLFTDNALAVEILRQIGLKNDWDDAPQLYGFSTVDMEAFVGVEDTNFFYVAQGDYNDTLTDLPVWSALPFVQSRRAYWLGGDAWLFGGPLSAKTLVDNVLQVMGVEMPEVIQTADQCEAGFWLFEHELLVGDPVCVPENPERVTYLLYPSYIYPFDVKPVGSWGLERDAANYPMIADWIMDGIVDHGMPPNLETLVELDPDLMLYDASRVADVVEELPMIAPLVRYDDSGFATWRDRHLFTGEVLGQLDVAEAQLELFDVRASELREALAESGLDVTEMTASLVRLRGDAGTNLLGPHYTSVAVLRDIGFNLPEAVNKTPEEMTAAYGNAYNLEISQEQIPLVDADIIILLGSVGDATDQSIEGDQLVAELMTDPLWNTLTAFQEGSVHSVRDYWLQSNLLTAHRVLDDLAEWFDVSISTPNPFLTTESGNSQG